MLAACILVMHALLLSCKVCFVSRYGHSVCWSKWAVGQSGQEGQGMTLLLNCQAGDQLTVVLDVCQRTGHGTVPQL
jgi:hypothetical protein